MPAPAPGENVFVGYGSWETYLELDAALGSRQIRVRFFRGQIELMSISILHETIKKMLGIFVECYCSVREKDYVVWGSTTQKRTGVVAREPDESYNFGTRRRKIPELIIEVALSSGGIEKLPSWAEMRVAEVWLWQHGKLDAYVLGKGGVYEPVRESRCLPGFPFAMAQKLATMEPASRAEREFRRQLAAGK